MYKDRIASSEIIELLGNPQSRETIDTRCRAEIRKLATKMNRTRYLNPSELDSKLYMEVYNTFKHLSNHITNDIRFWQYLALNELKNFVEKRFDKGRVPRYLGSQSMGGLSKNAISRLYRAGSQQGGDNVRSIIFSRQQIQQDLHERTFSLSQVVSKAFLKKAVDLNDDEITSYAVNIRKRSGTKLIFAMTEEDIEGISSDRD
jgi:hypothetical protein